MKRTVVIGGGVVGGTIALALQAHGRRLTVIDPDTRPRSASWGNAGHIAIEQVAPLAAWSTLAGAPRHLLSRNGALVLPLRDLAAWGPFALELADAARRFSAGERALTALMQHAMPAWARLVARLNAPGLLRREGHFIVWERAAAARAAGSRLGARDTPTARFADATPSELARLQALSRRPLAGAVRCEGGGQISDPDDLARALRARFTADGGEVLRAVAGLELDDGRARIRLPGAAPLDADLVVVAAGIGARALMRGIGHRTPLIAERGYHVQSPGADWPQDLAPVVFEERAIIVTRFRSGVRVAGFTEFAADDRPPDPRRWRRLRAHVTDLGLPIEAPSLAENEGDGWMGARPTLPDYLPAIGRSRHASNLVYAFGHQHLGLTLAPITAELVAAVAQGRAPTVSLAPFDLERFERRQPR